VIDGVVSAGLTVTKSLLGGYIGYNFLIMILLGNNGGWHDRLIDDGRVESIPAAKCVRRRDFEPCLNRGARERQNVGNACREAQRPYDILGLEAWGSHMRQNLGSASVR